MNSFFSSAAKVFKGAGKAFERFPMVIANAVAFSVVTLIRIHIGWQGQETYNFLFNCLHLSFSLGAIFSLAAITFAQSRYNSKKVFIYANLLGALATVITFLLLHYFGVAFVEYSTMRYRHVSALAAARVSAVMFVSFLLFIILAGHPEEGADISKSLFMVHKSFFIAAIYGLVIMGGTSGVAGAVQALLYKGLSSKVYGYIGTLSGFLAFTIFVGYFPDFRKNAVDKQREIAQKQPRFIEILFEYIITPIMLALTFVLILWAGKTVMGGMKVPFIRLSSIASSFAMVGIWLHIMITHNNSSPTKFYKKVYPIAIIFILIFEAWALIIQLQKTGLKITEYFFALVWIIALSSAILLLFKKEKAHHAIIIFTAVLTLISVAPYAGYNVLPVKTQISRLENLLKNEEILQDGKIVSAITEPEQNVRESITDAIMFLTSTEDASLPPWFDKKLRNSKTFKETLGFEQTYPNHDNDYRRNYLGTTLALQQEAIDIGDYRWAVNLRSIKRKEDDSILIEGERGIYKLIWEIKRQDGIPTLEILLNEKTILISDMDDYLDRILEKYPPGGTGVDYASLDDMSLTLETPEIKVMIVFGDIDINVDVESDKINYWINPEVLYINEK